MRILGFGARKRVKIPYLEINCCDHCNLNCAGCDHFCPLVTTPVFLDLEGYKKDIRILASKLKIGRIRLMGGEPLLNPELTEIIKVTRLAFPETDLRICSNGILLPTMREPFWRTLRENNITVDLSKYPIVGDKFLQYLDLLDDNGIRLGNIHLAKRFAKSYNARGDSDPRRTWEKCSSRECVNLWNHKLYPCSACFIEIGRKYFSLENIETPAPIDFYELSGRQIARALNKASNACRFCTKVDVETFAWRQSEKKASEFFYGIT